MIIEVSRDGYRAMFRPESEAQRRRLRREMPTLYSHAKAILEGSWIEVLKYMRSGRSAHIKNKSALIDFVRKRKQFLNLPQRSCTEQWMADGYSLRDYQRDGIVTFLKRRRLLLSDSVGLGKTLQAIGAFCVLRKLRPHARAVFVVESGDRLQWAEEVEKFVRDDFLAQDELAVIFGSKARRTHFLQQQRPLTIMSYHTLIHDVDQVDEHSIEGPVVDLFDGAHFVAFDEAVWLKNPNSITTERARTLTNHIPFRLLITATPMERDVEDLFGIFSVLDYGLFGSPQAYEKAYFKRRLRTYYRGGKQRRGYERIGSKNHDHLRRRIDHLYLRRTAQEVGEELPPLIPVPIWLELSTTDQKKYRKLKADAHLAHVRQFCCDPKIVGVEATSVKTNKILRLVHHEFRGEQILIFTEFRKYAVLLHEKLKKHSEMIVGGITDKRKQSHRSAFQRGDLRILIGDEAMSRGKNLQNASVVINADLPWVPTDLTQRAGRARRIGATAESIRVVTLLLRGTVEENMLRRLLGRVKTFDDLLLGEKEIESPFDNLTIHELKALM